MQFLFFTERSLRSGKKNERRGNYRMIRTLLSRMGCLRDRPMKRRRLLLGLAPLTLLGLVLCICMGPAPKDTDVYLLIDQNDTYTVTADSTLFYQSEALYAGQNNTGAVDVQLILPKGQEVLLTDTEEGSSASLQSPSGDVRLLAATDGSDQESTSVTTRRETVANLLRRSNIEVGDDEMVVVDLTSGTPSITVCRQYTRLRNVQVQTDYAVERIASPLMKKGTEEIITAGAPGSVTQTYLDIFVKGKLEKSEFISATADNSVTQVVKYGTLVDSVSRDDKLVNVHRNSDGSGYLVFASGDTMAFSSQVTCNASAYATKGYGASGRPTKYGNIAVDPSVFPYGTRFYIYTDDGYLTYGMATASDCGSSIKGYKLDLWFDTYREACRFGRRNCTVFVLK